MNLLLLFGRGFAALLGRNRACLRSSVAPVAEAAGAVAPAAAALGAAASLVDVAPDVGFVAQVSAGAAARATISASVEGCG